MTSETTAERKWSSKLRMVRLLTYKGEVSVEVLQGGYLLALSLVYVISCVSTELLLQLPGSGCQGNLSPTLLAALHSSWGVFFVS